MSEQPSIDRGHRYIVPALEELRDTGTTRVDMRSLGWPRRSREDRLGDPEKVLDQFRRTLRICIEVALQYAEKDGAGNPEGEVPWVGMDPDALNWVKLGSSEDGIFQMEMSLDDAKA